MLVKIACFLVLVFSVFSISCASSSLDALDTSPMITLSQSGCTPNTIDVSTDDVLVIFNSSQTSINLETIESSDPDFYFSTGEITPQTFSILESPSDLPQSFTLRSVDDRLPDSLECVINWI